VGSAWQGNWPRRIYDRVASKGYDTISGFAHDRPKETYLDLADELGNDVAPIQLIDLICREYCDRDDVEGYARDSLVRYMREEISDGWRVGDNFEFRRAGLAASWLSTMPVDYRDVADEVWTELCQSPKLYQGWLPAGPNDEILIEVFHKAGFK
jgi:hypothetical protein